MNETDQEQRPTRRAFLQGAVGAGIAGTFSAMPAWPAEAEVAVANPAPADSEARAPKSSLPNIVYIHSHDSGRYVRPYGHSISTPNLQRLADEGVLFRSAFSGAPTCSPSRAVLLTGMCAHKNGMLGLAHLGWSLNDYNQHIIHTLSKVGYTTILAGLQHVAANPETIGYDILLSHKNNSAVYVAPAAVEFLNSKPKEPFFLDVGFHETHRTYPEPTPADNPEFISPPSAVPDTAVTRRDMAAFHASARMMDTGVGAVLDALDRLGLAGNTLVLSTTDHGIAFPDMKCSLRDDGWGVSMIMRGPGEFRGGKRCDAMISQVDVFPTLCEYLDIAKPAWLEGASFLPVLRGEKQEINEQLFAEVTYHAAYEPKRAVRTARWKYIRRFDERTHAVLPNCDDSPSKTLWLEAGWQKLALVRQEQLYDLVFDPAEKNDLAQNTDYATVLHEMRGRLDSWMMQTNDPLLRGPVPLVPGGRTIDPNAISPHALGKSQS